jgi:membrane-associated phospholipid phosphatase
VRSSYSDLSRCVRSRRRAKRLPVRVTVQALILGVAALCLGRVSPCLGQAVQPREALEDAKLYVTAPLRWDQRDWIEFGSTIVALGVIYQFDDNVRNHFVGSSTSDLNGKDPHSTSDALPAAIVVGGTWLLAGVLDEPAGWRELGSMLESTIFTAASTEVFKLALGRERPNQTTNPDQWFQGGNSFPSRHVSIAFAVGTVLAESGDSRYRWVRRVLGYGIGLGTAYLRLDHNEHWASDVAAGAALGLSTARFVMGRRDEASSAVSINVSPATGGGAMLTFSVPVR